MNTSSTEDDRIILTHEQRALLHDITPETGDMILAMANAMARQYLDVLMELRAQVDVLQRNNHALREEVDHLRSEIADMRVAATMIAGLIAGRK